MKNDGTSWIQQRADNPRQWREVRRVGGAVNNKIRIGKEPASSRRSATRTRTRAGTTTAEVYDAYQDVDDAYYEREGEAEAVCYGGAVIEDID